MLQYDWGPHYLVPSRALLNYSGCVLLREEFDETLLHKQLNERRLSGSIMRVNNLWYYRRKNSVKWTKIGESNDVLSNFAVRWDTSHLENGQYEIIGFMQAFIRVNNSVKWEAVKLANGEYEVFGYKTIFTKKYREKRILGEQNIVAVTVEN
jgi:hypothetical protein